MKPLGIQANSHAPELRLATGDGGKEDENVAAKWKAQANGIKELEILVDLARRAQEAGERGAADRELRQLLRDVRMGLVQAVNKIQPKDATEFRARMLGEAFWSSADWIADGKDPDLVSLHRRLVEKHWALLQGPGPQGTKEVDARLRRKLFELCQSTASNIGPGYDLDRATDNAIGMTCSFVDASVGALVKSSRSEIRTLIATMARLPEKTTMKEATKAVFKSLKLPMQEYKDFRASMRVRRQNLRA